MFQAGCTIGYYGDKCLRQCHCTNASACDANTGHCESCAPGWTGYACDSVCSNGTYGKGCANACGHCINKQTCDHVTGNCTSGCEIGYYSSDSFCKTPKTHSGLRGRVLMGTDFKLSVLH
ncbi:scavenger receptor class F member 1-like [Mercenaria mercenaria]|uniref:scavenger receptor class F member 1-like n=1 Tax=Mercenaria mercenaria TaxID=6596 RepID=UPI00234F1483|nr:scavenger receptor class F member 1-like [Mercenaria mercenaria]